MSSHSVDNSLVSVFVISDNASLSPTLTFSLALSPCSTGACADQTNRPHRASNRTMVAITPGAGKQYLHPKQTTFLTHKKKPSAPPPAQDKPSTLVKFCENSWRCLYYSYSFVYGVIVLWDKPWFWDVKHCWYSYPHQSVETDIWWYYMISMAFYWSLTVTQFCDVLRKDFWQMFIHHVVTLLLLALSWVCNLHRVGSLVLVVHDCADIFLEVSAGRNGSICV